ncbi:MAG: PQQ-like beta-propeller repeat protein [Gemmataceae bacterium]|nr:PQQ-like beta-propeller repeat protein [Gemmataceae bacterium]
MTRSSTWLVLGCTCFVAAPVSRADQWPQWRGPNGDGIVTSGRVPAEWAEDKNIAWKVPLPGKAGSTPIVWNERIFLTSAKGNDIILLCLNDKGQRLWERTLSSSGKRAYMRDEGNDASASPSTDGHHVYSFVGSGDLACHDFDGNEIWTINVQKRYGKFSIQHGVHITPLLHGDRLYVVLLHSNGHWIVALDKRTGQELWKVARPSDAVGESREAYASPILWNDGRRTLLVVLGCDYATAHELDDGREVWRLTDLNPKASYSTALRIIASPVAARDLLVVPTARGGLVVGVKPGAVGKIGPGSAFEAWRRPSGAGDVPSPLIHDGLVYLPQHTGVLVCVDGKTGKQLYSVGLHRDRYRASPILVDGKLIITSRDGHFSVVKPGPKFELLAENTLNDEFTASPIVAHGRLYLRGFRSLYAVSATGK